MVLWHPAFDSFIPSEFVANKQTLWACYFILDSCGAVNIQIRREWIIAGARQLCVSRPVSNPIREGGLTHQKLAVILQTVMCNTLAV